MKIVGKSQAAPFVNCASPADFVPRRPLPQAMGREGCSLAAGLRRDSIKGVEFF